MKTSFTLTLDVTYKAHKAIPGARDSIGGVRDTGPLLEPDEPACIEIVSVVYNGQEITLTAQDEEELEVLIADELSDE